MFLWDVYRVSLDPVILWGPAALLPRGRGDVPRLAVPPAHDYRSLNSGNDLLFTLSTLSTNVYNVLHRLTPSYTVLHRLTQLGYLALDSRL